MTPVLLDENVPYEVAKWLQARAFNLEVSHVHDLQFTSRSDEALYAWATERQAIIVTFDEDFADQRRFPVGGRCGVIRLRIDPTTEASTCAALSRVIETLSLESFLGKLAIVDARRIRIVG